MWTLLILAVSVTRCHGRPGPEEPGHSGHHLIPLTEDLSIRLFPFPHLTRTRDPSHVSHVSAVDTSRIQGENKRRVAFFTDNPLITVKRSFQVEIITVLSKMYPQRLYSWTSVYKSR